MRPVAAVGRHLGALLPGARARRAQTDRYASWWAERNADTLRTRRVHEPLWVALGDSASQGIGATMPERGWVLRTLRLLREEHDTTWRVINLSVSGARIADVLDRQLPQLAHLPTASLVTCAVGTNDLLRGRSATVLTGIDRLLEALPHDAVVATIPRGVRERLARRVNARIRDACTARSLRVADVWATTGPPWSGKYAADGFHPNDRGYEEWVDAFAKALALEA